MARGVIMWGIKTREALVMDRVSEAAAIAAAVDSMDPRRLIDTCEEWVRWDFRGLVCCLALAGFGKIRVTAGRRTFEEQVMLYGLGRSADEMAVIGQSSKYARPKLPRVSWLQPEYSRHVAGAAIDLDLWEYEESSFDVIAEVCRNLGIMWGGVWSVRDYAHFEL